MKIDWEKVDSLCRIHATAGEIHSCLNDLGQVGSYDTLDRRAKDEFGISFAAYITQKQNTQAKPRLRQLQWGAAEKGSVPMLIWLGKQYLGQSDKADVSSRTEHTGPDRIEIVAADMTDRELMKIIQDGDNDAKN